MRFKAGDKVKFLNESGGGVVKRVISPGLVAVEIEDGFEVPVMPSELVLDIRGIQEEELKKKNHQSDDIFRALVDEAKSDIETEEAGPEERKTKIMRMGFRGNVADGLYLAFVPHDQKWLVTGEIDILILNHTPYDVLYSYFLINKEEGFEGYDYDVMEANNQILLETIDRKDLGKWLKGLVQFIFHKDESNEIPLPANCEIDIKPARIFKEGNYRETPLMAEKAFIYSLVELKTHARTERKQKYDVIEKLTRKAKEVKKEALIDKYRSNENEAVVDLHIGELVDNISGMSSHDMLNYQKDYFIKVLESAIAENYKRVTFIHGVGNGVLRDEIVKILKDYENTQNQSASLAKFGVGAVDVLIRRNA